jgi:superoxide dismutase, Cu-Zn family
MRRAHLAMTAVAVVSIIGLTGAGEVSGGHGATPIATPPAADVPATALIHTASGEWIGTVDFVPVPGGLFVSMHVEGQTPGAHGTHIHERGECAPGVDHVTGQTVPFGAAGGHFDPEQTGNHGHPDEPADVAHAGDLPSVVVDAQGDGELEYTTPDLTLEGAHSIVGRSIAVHANPDDYATDPAGNSGSRIACGVIVAVPTIVTARYPLHGDAVFPEGVATDPAGTVAYTGSTTDGTVYRVDVGAGTSEVLRAGGAPGLTTAIGMKLDGHGRLLVAGGGTGQVGVLDADDGSVIALLPTPPAPATFLNDLAVAPDGAVYVTDSQRPVLFRLRTGASGVSAIEPWLDLTTTPIQYVTPGANLNGIVVTADGRYLVAVQTNVGKLWRIDTATKEVREVDLGGTLVTGGDGLLLLGDQLYVLQNAIGRISRWTLDADAASATFEAAVQDRNFGFPTTLAALGDDELIVVNAQFNRRMGPVPPVLPFVLTAILRDW